MSRVEAEYINERHDVSRGEKAKQDIVNGCDSPKSLSDSTLPTTHARRSPDNRRRQLQKFLLALHAVLCSPVVHMLSSGCEYRQDGAYASNHKDA
jgi:hypothetical protein